MSIPNVVNRVVLDTIREIAAGSISGTYAAIGTALVFPARIAVVSNGMDAGLYISDDGINDKWRVPANSFKLIDLTTNELVFPEGLTFYTKQVSSAPTAGDLWIEIIGTTL